MLIEKKKERGVWGSSIQTCMQLIRQSHRMQEQRAKSSVAKAKN